MALRTSRVMTMRISNMSQCLRRPVVWNFLVQSNPKEPATCLGSIKGSGLFYSARGLKPQRTNVLRPIRGRLPGNSRRKLLCNSRAALFVSEWDGVAEVNAAFMFFSKAAYKAAAFAVPLFVLSREPVACHPRRASSHQPNRSSITAALQPAKADAGGQGASATLSLSRNLIVHPPVLFVRLVVSSF